MFPLSVFLFLIGQMPPGIICRNSDGFAIEALGRFLPQDQFTRENLSNYFNQYTTTSKPEELTVQATSDLEYFQKTNTPRVRPFYMDKDFNEEVIDIRGPIARFYRINNNAFFEYRDAAGKIEWVVLKGKNVLSPSINGTQVHYLGQYFFGRSGEESCVDQKRYLRLVIPAIDKLDAPAVQSILIYIDSMLTYPGNLDITIYGSFTQATSHREFNLPSLEALAGGYGDRSEPIGKHVYYFRDRLMNGKYIRRMDIKDGERMIQSQELTLP